MDKLKFHLSAFLVVALLWAPALASAQDTTSSSNPFSAVDDIVHEVLASTAVPSASIAIVKSGRLVYARAYGNACLDPVTSAKPEMSYSIGSISKQFTAAAILLLSEQGKLSLDDPVSRFFPALTQAGGITVRQLLSHTSGYEDYWPQDYLPPFMLVPVTEEEILDRWARKSLDFAPGTQWQYSNTGFVIAGLIVEQVSGMKLFDFLHKYIFAPLQMENVANVDDGSPDATGYVRYALGPSRLAPNEGKGWLFGAAELGMPARELAKWDISIIRQTLLQPASYKQMETEIVLKNGLGTNYGLGLGVKTELGHRALEHGGEVSGFTAENWIFPDDGVAVVVLTNQDPANAAPNIMRRIAGAMFAEDRVLRELKLDQARQIFNRLRKGQIDRSLFTANANSYFSDQALKDFAGSLGPLGPPLEFIPGEQEDRGGMIFRSYRVQYSDRMLEVWVRELPDGKIEQYQVKMQ